MLKEVRRHSRILLKLETESYLIKVVLRDKFQLWKWAKISWTTFHLLSMQTWSIKKEKLLWIKSSIQFNQNSPELRISCLYKSIQYAMNLRSSLVIWTLKKIINRFRNLSKKATIWSYKTRYRQRKLSWSPFLHIKSKNILCLF